MIADHWWVFAACYGEDTNRWYPELGADRGEVQAAIEVCRGCPVRVPCLNRGMGEHDGIWGGLEVEIRAIIRRWARTCPVCATPIERYGARLVCSDACLDIATQGYDAPAVLAWVDRLAARASAQNAARRRRGDSRGV